MHALLSFCSHHIIISVTVDFAFSIQFVYHSSCSCLRHRTSKDERNSEGDGAESLGVPKGASDADDAEEGSAGLSITGEDERTKLEEETDARNSEELMAPSLACLLSPSPDRGGRRDISASSSIDACEETNEDDDDEDDR